MHLPHGFQSSTLQSTGNINQRANIFYDSNSDCITFSSNYGLWCSCFEYDAFGDEDDDDFPNSWFPFFDWIEITNCRADSCKVDFNDGVVFADPFQSTHLKPASFLIVELKHLKTRKISHDQLMNSTQYLISGVSPIIPTSHKHLLVYVSSSKVLQLPKRKN